MSASPVARLRSSAYRGLKYIVERCATLLLLMRGIKLPRYFDCTARLKLLKTTIEPDLHAVAGRIVSKGQTILDIGGNVGLIARLFCRHVGTSGRVIIFEPEAENLAALRHNMRGFPQAEIVPLAISDNDRPATFYINCISGTGNSLIGNAPKTRAIQVQCQTLDAFLASRPDITPDLIKIDVEGGEFLVLNGMHETIRRFPNARVLIELCPDNLGGDAEATRLAEKLKAFGYRLEVIRRDGSTTPFHGVNAHPDDFAPHGYVNLLAQRPLSTTGS